MNSIKVSLIVFLVLGIGISAVAQDDLLDELMESSDNEISEEVNAVFKGTRIIHGHSVKLRSRSELEMLISHRFGLLNSGGYNLFGLDDAQMRIGFDYGVSDRLNIGIGRSSFDKTYDGFVKGSLIQQRTNGSPFSMVGLLSAYIKTFPQAKFNPDISMSDRMAFTTGLLLARKFNSNLSLQLMPVWIHKNSVIAPDINEHIALGTGIRYKVTPSVSINMEYYYRLNAPETLGTYNSLALGVDIETGGHVFQLHLSNSRGMMERSFITETTGDLSNGDIHFGFNISRTFQLGKSPTN